MPIRVDQRALDIAAGEIWRAYATEAVLRSRHTDPRIRARLARMQELERVHGRQRVLFDERRPR
jgi:hypothetical protein